jgi:hypothetical protein
LEIADGNVGPKPRKSAAPSVFVAAHGPFLLASSGHRPFDKLRVCNKPATLDETAHSLKPVRESVEVHCDVSI